MKSVYKVEGKLSLQQIDDWMTLMEETCAKASKADHKEILRAKLQLEEIMLRARENFGSDKMIAFGCVSGRRKLIFSIEIEDRELPLRASYGTATMEAATTDLMDYLGAGPMYRYSRGVNRVFVDIKDPKKKLNILQQIMIAMVLAIVTGLAFSAGPLSGMAGSVNSGIVTPLFNKLITILAEFATPMIFLSVALGIISMGDLTAFGKIGKIMLSRFLMTYALASVVATGVLVGLYGLSTGTASQEGGAAKGTLQLFLDIIPNNILEPFTSDNDLQVITLSVLFGIIALGMMREIPTVLKICKELSSFINKIMGVLCKILPMVVFLGILNMILSGSVKQIAQCWKAILAFLICVAVIDGFLTIRAKMIIKRPLGQMIREMLPTLLINLATSSQIAALPSNIECCKDKWKIDPRVVDFGVPFGMVVYMPNGAAMINIIAWSAAYMAGVPIDLNMAIILAIVTTLVAIAAPPIPGSAMLVFPIVMTAAGLPMDFMSVALIMASLIGYFLPAVNGYALQLEIYISAVKAGSIMDEEAAE